MKRLIGVLCLVVGVQVLAQTNSPKTTMQKAKATPTPGKTRVVYKENQTLDFDGLSLEGELKAPGEFYFQNRNQERFDTLTKRRLNFKREMLRDSIQSN